MRGRKLMPEVAPAPQQAADGAGSSRGAGAGGRGKGKGKSKGKSASPAAAGGKEASPPAPIGLPRGLWVDVYLTEELRAKLWWDGEGGGLEDQMMDEKGRSKAKKGTSAVQVRAPVA